MGGKKGGHVLFSHPRLCVSVCKDGGCVCTCVCAYMTLEVEGVVEAFSTEAAEVSLCIAVTLDMSVQHSLV